MATNTSPQTEITTADIDPSMVPPTVASSPAPAVHEVAPAASGAAQPEPVVDRGDPDIPNETAEQARGVGIEGETTVWEARYALRNFLGRLVGLGLLVVGWVILAIYTWAGRETRGGGLSVLTIVIGIVVAILALALARRMIWARYGHFYRLTNRRLFVSTGVFRRRVDQMELLAVKDVFIRETFTQRLLSLGTVVAVASDPNLPVMYLAGVTDPKIVMDLVWHHARAERDRRSLKAEVV